MGVVVCLCDCSALRRQLLLLEKDTRAIGSLQEFFNGDIGDQLKHQNNICLTSKQKQMSCIVLMLRNNQKISWRSRLMSVAQPSMWSLCGPLMLVCCSNIILVFVYVLRWVCPMPVQSVHVKGRQSTTTSSDPHKKDTGHHNCRLLALTTHYNGTQEGYGQTDLSKISPAAGEGQ